MKAVIYARYSSQNQREESIEGQIRECTDFANKNDLIIVDEYIDRAVSGKTDNRPAFQKLIRDSEKGKFSAVIMYTLDRFARNRYDSAIYKAKLKKNGVRVFYAKQPLPDTPEGIILESVLEGYAEYYSENLSRNVKRGMTENALQAIAMGQLPLGYRIGTDRKYEIEPLGAKAVDIIFNMYADGKSAKFIEEYLNANGYKTAKGNPFNRNSLKTILRNEKYIGLYKYDDVMIENAVPAIVSKELFDRVNAKLKVNKVNKARSKADEEYILTTKLFCGHCGAPMIGESGTSKTGRTYRYYKCANQKKNRSCDKKPEKKEILEALIIRYTVENVLTDPNISRIADKIIELVEKEARAVGILDELKNKLRETNNKLKNITIAIEQGIITETTKDRLIELENDRGILEQKIAREENKKPILTKDRVVFWLESFRNGDVNDSLYQIRIIDTLINSIFIYDTPDKDRRIICNFNTSQNNSHTISSSDIAHFGAPFFILKRGTRTAVTSVKKNLPAASFIASASREARRVLRSKTESLMVRHFFCSKEGRELKDP